MAIGNVYSVVPAWNMGIYNSWGIGTVASTAIYSDYVNPYSTVVVANQPAQAVAAPVYDYSQPINTAATPPDASVEESADQVFSAARDSFKAGDYQRALDLADQVIKQTPNAPVVHEFRALCLFALKRYDEAASVAYAVLSSGPGWNWTTLAGLYASTDDYTNQLRSLEAAVRGKPDSPALQFLLGYHYLVQGHDEVAGKQFEKVSQLEPQDQLAATFVKALKKVNEPAPTIPTSATVATATPPAASTTAPNTPASATNTPAAATNTPAASPDQTAQSEPQQPPPPPPADLLGTWKAQPAPQVTISLTLEKEGKFQWTVDEKGHKQTLEGQAGFEEKDNVLALLQDNGPPLVGKVTKMGGDKFVFAPPGAKDKSSLTFTR